MPTESLCPQVSDKSQVLKVSRIEFKFWPLHLTNDLEQIHLFPFNLHLIKCNHCILIGHNMMFQYGIHYIVFKLT